MSHLAATVTLNAAVTERAARWYAAHPVPHAFEGLPPRVRSAAQRLAGGDWQRCVLNEDGSVTVHNHQMWVPTPE